MSSLGKRESHCGKSDYSENGWIEIEKKKLGSRYSSDRYNNIESESNFFSRENRITKFSVFITQEVEKMIFFDVRDLVKVTENKT